MGVPGKANSNLKTEDINPRTYAMLQPLLAGLTGKKKPVVLLVHALHNDLNYDFGVQLLKGMHYKCINQGELNFYQKNIMSFVKNTVVHKTNQVAEKLTLTIWLESHGGTGWLFGNEHKDITAREEFDATATFAEFVKRVETDLGATVDKIVLSGCFTANEIVCPNNPNNPKTMTHMISPARMLSLLLTDKQIFGFVGQNASAKVTHVYLKTDDRTYEMTKVKLEDATILFLNGTAIESYFDLEKARKEIYCSHENTPDFIRVALGIKGEGYYRSCLIEKIEKNSCDFYKNCYATKQRMWADTWLAAQKGKSPSVNGDNNQPINTTNPSETPRP